MRVLAVAGALLSMPTMGLGAGFLSARSDVQNDKNRPVSKVITLLKDMMTQLEKEAAEDEEIYDKMACWCETNDKEKTQAIADAEARIADLTTKIEEATANSARLSAEIGNLEKEVAANQESLDQATAIRQKQLAEFNGEEKDLLQSISALGSAIVVLSKHHSSLVQVPRTHVLSIAATLQHEMQKHASLLVGVLTPSERKNVQAFIQAPEDYFDAAPTFKQSFAPQSGEIFGILKQMKESFETNLVKAQQDEKGAVESFNEMKAAKNEEMAAGNAGVNSKSTELAAADQLNAESKEDLEDTTVQLDADRVFLADVRVRCAAMDKQFAERSKVRNEEITAVSEALEILTDDDAKDLMSRSTFIQTSMHASSKHESLLRQRAATLIKNAARRTGSPQLSALAVTMKSDVFGKIKESIDLMIALLKKEMKEEVEKKDWCRDELHKNEMAMTGKYEEKEDAEATIGSLEALISRLNEEVAAAEAAIKQTQIDIKQASENRQKANSEFQTTVSDQRATQQILAKAMDKLKGFYSKKASLLQAGRQAPDLVGAAPPGEFQPYKKKGGAGGIMGLMENIINESKHVEDEARTAEQEQQAGYEQFMVDSGNEIKALQAEITDKQARAATADADHVRAKEDLAGIAGDLEDLNQYNKETHGECDYITHNFETRQAARTDEVEALDQAKAVLSGASV